MSKYFFFNIENSCPKNHFSTNIYTNNLNLLAKIRGERTFQVDKSNILKVFTQIIFF